MRHGCFRYGGSRRRSGDEYGLADPDAEAYEPTPQVPAAVRGLETRTGRIITITGDEVKTVVGGLDHPDQIEFAPDGALWISEDAKPGRLLRYSSGHLELIMAGLMAPQGIAFGRNGEVYVAEQKRNRILVLRRTAR